MEGMKSPSLFILIVMSAAIAAAQTAPAGPSSIIEIFDSELAGQTALASSATLSYTIAHFPYGGGLTTRIAVANNGTATATAKFTFFDKSGLSTSVPLEGSGLKSTQTVTVGANQKPGDYTVEAVITDSNSLPFAATVPVTIAPASTSAGIVLP